VQGITGTLPNTGLFLRTNANVQAKATHRMSNFMNIVILGVITLALSRQFSFLPQAGAAAILASGSIRMVPTTYLKNLWKIDKWRLALTLGVTAISVIQDPVVGLLVGIFIAFCAEAKNVVDGKETCDIRPLNSITGKPSNAYKVTLNGPLSYITGEQVENYTKLLRGSAKVVVVNMECVNECDTDGLLWLERCVKGLQKDECAVAFSKVRRSVAERMRVVDGLAEFEKTVLSAEAQETLLDSDLGDESGGTWAQKIPVAKGGANTMNGKSNGVKEANAISL